jgi:DGQHR domain-containing protein
MVIDVLNLKTPVPCIQGTFGDRLVSYTTQASPKQILNLLGHDPRSKNWKRLPDDLRQIYEYLQRKTDKNRRESIAAYIEDRLGPDNIAIGAFPAISIAFQKPIEFIPYGGSIQNAVGNLMVDISPSNIRVLIDGLGRVTGALELGDEGQEALLDRFQFPITIYAPAPNGKALSWKEMGQLFHDFNFRVQPVSKQLAIALDTSDVYIALAGKLADCSFISENGGVAERSASLGSKSTNLLIQTLLVRTVRGACEGRKFQEADLTSVETPNLTKDTFNSLLSSIDSFFSAFASKMGKERFTDRQSLHLTSPGWQALGILHHDIAFKLKLDVVERLKVADKLASIDWSRHNQDWLTLGIGHPEIDKKTGATIVDSSGRQKIALTGAGRTNVQKLLDYMRERTGLSERLKPYSDDQAEAA